MSIDISPVEQIRRVNSAGNEFSIEDHFVGIDEMIGIGEGDYI